MKIGNHPSARQNSGTKAGGRSGLRENGLPLCTSRPAANCAIDYPEIPSPRTATAEPAAGLGALASFLLNTSKSYLLEKPIWGSVGSRYCDRL
jgi:hypothetical protein